MLMIGKEELARRMYSVWCASAKRNKVWGKADKVWSWDQIGDSTRQCWLDTAEAAAKLLADAMAAA